MQDVWSAVSATDDVTQERLAGVLETRGADPRQRAMRRAFLSDIAFPAHARVLDIGCGTGVLTRVLARWPDIDEVVGVDPATSFLDKGRELAANMPNITFQEADGRNLPFDDATFDVAVYDSTLSHVPDPEQVLAEALRVLRPQGWLAAIDGDYATATVALSEHDPLQACVNVMMANSVTDRWLMRRLPAIVLDSGFDEIRIRSHGFVETTEGGYMLTVVDRGADFLCSAGQIGDGLATAVKEEARRRVDEGAFFGHIAYVSLTARKPSRPREVVHGG